ncbi:hypothetical protein TNCV_3730841 [Trichonephila clavipes]|nr:hypothetical protein TNCV_3730841 [Trichonephila clavipes]
MNFGIERIFCKENREMFLVPGKSSLYRKIRNKEDGRDSLVVKVTESWLACHEFEPSAAEDPPCRGSDVSSKEFPAVDDDNLRTAPIITDKDILEFVQSSKNIIDANSDEENEMNNTTAVPTTSK